MNSSQVDPQSYTEADADGARWMTFKELAALRGISKLSAVSLVRRHGWRRQRDNQGHVRALVPAAWTESQADNQSHMQPEDEADNQADTRTYAATFETALAAIEAAHAGEVAVLRDQLDAAERGRLSAQTMADQAMAMLADATAQVERVEQAVAGERARADALRAKAEEAAATIVAERTRADHAEAALGAERTRASTLRDKVEVLQAEAVEAEAKAEQAEERGDRAQAELERARAAGIEALQTAEALRQAEAERKARGLLARLRAALRGE